MASYDPKMVQFWSSQSPKWTPLLGMLDALSKFYHGRNRNAELGWKNLPSDLWEFFTYFWTFLWLKSIKIQNSILKNSWRLTGALYIDGIYRVFSLKISKFKWNILKNYSMDFSFFFLMVCKKRLSFKCTPMHMCALRVRVGMWP